MAQKQAGNFGTEKQKLQKLFVLSSKIYAIILLKQNAAGGSSEKEQL